MAAQKFLSRLSGVTRLISAIQTSSGASDGGKIPALDDSGKLDMSVMPNGTGSNTNIVQASEALSAGSFVNFFSDASTLKVRLADNSNGREANGYVLASVASAAMATVYPLDGVNSQLSGLTVVSYYWLGTAGGVISMPLDETAPANANKVSQKLGRAKSATELITDDFDPVIL
mgnify:FL=1